MTIRTLRIRNSKLFSLVEIVAVVAILAILFAAAFEFLSTTQNLLKITDSKRTAAENARIALDLISTDVQNAYYGSPSLIYGDSYAPFWHWGQNHDGTPIRPSSWGKYRNELLAFITKTLNPPNDSCTSSLHEVKYQLYYATSHNDSNEGWLRRSITGNISDGISNGRWNFLQSINHDGYLKASYNTSSDALTATSASSEDYQRLIPYVTDLKFDCFDVNGNIIYADTNTSSSTTLTNSSFPFYLEITLSVLDENSWEKWIDLQGSSVYPAAETSDANTYRLANQQTFILSVYIGDRGQL